MKALVIDGNSLIYRMFFASFNQLDYYKKNNLQPVNALKLVLLTLLKILTSTKYEYALVAFDAGKKTLRHDSFEDYKKGRPSMPQELVSQLPLIEDAINALGIQTLKIERIEADDIIGSYCKLMNKDNINVDVYSSDKDMLQLVNELTTVKLFKTGISDTLDVTLENFGEVFYGLTPLQVTDFKGISGDSSDNLCGVKGVGPTTATKLIKKYGSMESIYENIDELVGKTKDKFIEGKEMAFQCKQLSSIDKNLMLDESVFNFINRGIDKTRLTSIINKYHFSGFSKYLDQIV
jgi:DNA polymerase-1